LSGLGEDEAAQTKQAIKAFERQNPSIKVKLDVLSFTSPNSPLYSEQLERQLQEGAAGPDLVEIEMTQTQVLEKAGWIASLSRFKPDLGRFFRAEIAASEVAGAPYAIPWFTTPEGLFYRTDLVPREPKAPAEIVSAASAAVARDRMLKSRPLNESFAFAGYKNEAIGTFTAIAPSFGGDLTATSIDTKGNVEALNWLREAIYSYRIAPKTVASWDVGPVQDEFSAGRTAFAIDYPFVAANKEPGSPTNGKFDYVPFPARPGGKPGAALAGEMLAINAKSRHAVAAYKLIEFLTSPAVEVARAESASYDPPSLRLAYTPALYATRPVFKQVKLLNEDAQPGLLSPEYPQIALVLKSAFSAVFAHAASASSALRRAASQIDTIEHKRTAQA
jgi:multiple sugar transport system substrate-binding protein